LKGGYFCGLNWRLPVNSTCFSLRNNLRRHGFEVKKNKDGLSRLLESAAVERVVLDKPPALTGK